jgi:hypothetical protein
MLFHLGYVSTETRPMRGPDLAGLLQSARDFNRAHDVTGLLLYREGSFLQVLEGREEDVRLVFDRIRHDPRHQDVKVLFEQPLEAREFSDWRMAFIDLDGVDIAGLPGFSDFLIDEREPRRFLEALSQSKRLLLLFRAMS